MKRTNIAVVAMLIVCYCLSLAMVSLWHTHIAPSKSATELTSTKAPGKSGSGHSPFCVVCLKINSTQPWNDQQAVFNFSLYRNYLLFYQETEKLSSAKFQIFSNRAPPFHTFA